MSLLDAMLAAAGAPAPLQPHRPLGPLTPPVNVAPQAWQAPHPLTDAFRGGRHPAPQGSADLERVLALPRRPPLDLNSEAARVLAREVTARFYVENKYCECRSLSRPCIKSLNTIQAWGLDEAPRAGGLVGPIAAGAGKTIMGLLMPLAFDDAAAAGGRRIRTAVIFVPPQLVVQLERDYLALSQHFRVPNLILPKGRSGPIRGGVPTVHVVPYSILSRPESTGMLHRLAPDLVLADEVHRCKNLDGAGTSRLFRALDEAEKAGNWIPFCGWSGTITNHSLLDYAHLSLAALGAGSPVPIDSMQARAWSLAVDPDDNGREAPAGALMKLCDPAEHVRDALRRRQQDTLGWVATTDGALVGASLLVHERKAPDVPGEIRRMLADVRNRAQRPDGEELVDDMSVARCARELASGFFYRWKFPPGHVQLPGGVRCGCVAGGEACENCKVVITRWFSARKAWNSEVRQKLLDRAEHLDSPKLLQNAAERAVAGYDGPLPIWKTWAWAPWDAVRRLVLPVQDTVWVDEYLAADAAQWAHGHRGVVWYESDAFGEKVAQLSGLPKHAGGPDAEKLLLAEDGSRSIVCSIKAHGTGRDGLQRLFAKQLVANPPQNGLVWEQLIARMHRPGQTADEVETFVYRHTAEYRDGIDRAIRHAKYVEQTMGNSQKLLLATVTFDPEGA